MQIEMCWKYKILTLVKNVNYLISNFYIVYIWNANIWSIRSQIKYTIKVISCMCLLFFYCFLGLNLQHMEVPRLGVKLELQLLAYTTATVTWDPSLVCKLHHSSQQCQVFNPLIEARNQISILMDTSRVCYHWAMMGTSCVYFLKVWLLEHLNYLCSSQF